LIEGLKKRVFRQRFNAGESLFGKPENYLFFFGNRKKRVIFVTLKLKKQFFEKYEVASRRE
jgi:hypothetical protein